MEEYVEALADMEPVELSISSNNAPGAAFSVPVEAYAEAVEEWSGGKITFEVVYSGAIVGITEASQAMADGLMDMGFWSYGTVQESFPIAATAQQMLFLQQPSPVAGSLELLAAGVEQSANEDLYAEVEGQGLAPLLPLLPTTPPVVLCPGEPVASTADAQGKTVRPGGGAGLATELEQVGFTPVAIPFAEAYDAMQRGVVKCEASPIVSQLVAGEFEIADHLTMTEVPFTTSPAAFSASLAMWEELPLPAQQLLFDRLDVFLAAFSQEMQFDGPAEALAVAQENGVEFHEWTAEDLQPLQDYHDSLLEDIAQQTTGGVDGQTLVDEARAAHDKWREIVVDLGYEDEALTWQELPAWLETNPLDLEPIGERIMEEALAAHRPE